MYTYKNVLFCTKLASKGVRAWYRTWWFFIIFPDHHLFLLLENFTIKSDAHSCLVAGFMNQLQLKLWSTQDVSSDTVISTKLSEILILASVGGLKWKIPQFEFNRIWGGGDSNERFPRFTFNRIWGRGLKWKISSIPIQQDKTQTDIAWQYSFVVVLLFLSLSPSGFSLAWKGSALT